MTTHEAMLDALLVPGPRLQHHFGHREHLGVAMVAHRRFGPRNAELVLRGALSALAERSGQGDRYHDTLTRFWSQFVGHALDTVPTAETIDELTDRLPALLSKDAPVRHWSDGVLWSGEARRHWVDADVVPLPWRDGSPAPDREAPAVVSSGDFTS